MLLKDYTCRKALYLGMNMTYEDEVKLERPLSEGDQIKVAIRTLFVESRNGSVFTEEDPLRVPVHDVNGSAEKTLCLIRHQTKPGALVLWYE